MKKQKLLDGRKGHEVKSLMENVLNEISYEYAEHVEDFLDNEGGYSHLPFGDLFGNQSRIVIPFGQAINPSSEIYRIMRWLESQGYEVDFKTGLASKEFESYTGNPNDPNTKKVMRMKQQKIGKVLQRAYDLSMKVTNTQADLYSMRRAFYERNPDRQQAVMRDDELEKDPGFVKATKAFRKAEEDYQKHFSRATPYPSMLQNYVEYWNKNSRYFRENPEEAFVDYSIVISRHPVDVLRMSDHRNIQSCHSEGNSHFHCAIKEAKSAGAIAYIVETQDLDDVDIEDDNEIFEDRDRDVDGIEPVGRTRLRRFDKTGTFTSEEKYSLLIPEKRIYGQDMAGFYEKIRDWALESQKDKWSQALVHDVERETDENPDPMKMDPDYLRDFVYMGGEYQDTNSRSMFKSFFADHGGADFEHASGGRYGDDESQERDFIQGQNIEYYIDQINDVVDSMERAARDAAYNLDEDQFLTEMHYEVVDPQNFEEWTYLATNELAEYYDAWQDQYDMYPIVTGRATLSVRVQLNGPEADDFDASEALAREIIDEIDMYTSGYVYDYELEEDYAGFVELNIRIEVGGSADEFEGFCSDISDDLKKEQIYRQGMISVLQHYGFAKPGFSDVLQKDIQEERESFQKFILQSDNGGGYTLIYPMEMDALVDVEDGEEDIEVPAGRMPTMELLHAKYGDVYKLQNRYTPVYSSKKFTVQIIRRMAKLFGQAHMSAKRQLKLPLSEQEESEREITVEDIQDYITPGFTLGFADIKYEKASGRGKETISDYTPKVGTPIKTTLAVVRFTLDDEPHYDLSFERTEELFKASINFIKMLDSDISLLTEEIAGVLQTLSPKQEQTHADKGLKIKALFQEISDLGNKIDDEIDALVKLYRDDLSKIDNLRINPERLQSVTAWFGSTSSSPPPRTGKVKPSKWSIRALGTRLQYRTGVFKAFKDTMMEQYVEDRLDILDDLERIGNDIRNMDNPKKWGELTDQHYNGYRGAIKRMLNRWNALQTVEELSRLFESVPNLMNLINNQLNEFFESK